MDLFRAIIENGDGRKEFGSSHTLFWFLILANNSTVFTRLGPLRPFPVLKTEGTQKGRRFGTKKDFARIAQDYVKKLFAEVLRGLEKALAQVYYI